MAHHRRFHRNNSLHTSMGRVVMAKIIGNETLQQVVNQLALIPYHYVYQIMPILTNLSDAPEIKAGTPPASTES